MLFVDVLSNLLKKFGNKNIYKEMSLDAMKDIVKEDLKGVGNFAGEKQLVNKFLRKLDKFTSKDDLLMSISNTMFNLSGMSM